MRIELLPLEPGCYRPHDLHAGKQVWTETNCYVDLWVEVLHALGVEPLAAAGFALSAGFEGDQWTFIKFLPEDLRSVLGIEVLELTIWRPVREHLIDHLAAGRLLTLEVDSWFLPDTRATAYHQAHVKTTIVAQMIDPDEGRLGYFHGPGYFELEGDDYAGLLEFPILPPYVELARLEGLRRDASGILESSLAAARAHLARRPVDNPVMAMMSRLMADLPGLVEAGPDAFHAYAFAGLRQCGSSAQLAGQYLLWLAGGDGHGSPDEATNLRAGGDLRVGAGHFHAAAETARSIEFALARIFRGRRYDLETAFARLSSHWLAGIEVADAILAG